MQYTYEQHGTVALIKEGDKFICTAVLKEGFWEVYTVPSVAEASPGLQRVPNTVEIHRTLDAMVESFNARTAR